MVTAIRRPSVLDSEQAGDTSLPRERPGRVSAGHAIWWRWLPWTAPRLRLANTVRPQTRLELALCALYRCRLEWPAAALVERLALAPAGSEDNTALVSATLPPGPRRLGRGAAWDVVSDWLRRGLLIESRGDAPTAEALETAMTMTASRASARPQRAPWPSPRSPSSV